MELAPLGSLYEYLKSKSMTWKNKAKALLDISIGLGHLHDKGLIHKDFHPGNLLFNNEMKLLITDFGLCELEDQSLQPKEIHGVMPYVAPEVLRSKPYTQAADIYSFGMIMYFVATKKQPFNNYAHDEQLAIKICNGDKPGMKKLKAPKCYINLMEKCWDLNPNSRPNIIEIKEKIESFYNALDFDKQFKEAGKDFEEELITHPQAIYTSRLLNSYTDDLPRCDDDVDNDSEFYNVSYIHFKSFFFF
jgi:serine/threonine protein kinase